jgi:UDP-4-amino-4,6-dideoxy-N-acetyl-beta-L-altrosamine N-acetyltransferase
MNNFIHDAPLVRPMTRRDLALVLAWRNHDEVRHYMYTQAEISLIDHERWFEEVSKDPCRHLLIFESDNVPLGFINFHAVGSTRVVDWGFYAAPDAPRGTGRQLGKIALEFAFGQMGFYKVCGQTLAYNIRSINLHRRLGFLQEGVLRSQHFDGERYHDVLCFGLLEHEWQANV